MNQEHNPSLRSRAETARDGFAPSRAARAAFSLVELLVALGIIILLMGLLFPVLSRVRAAGDRTRSMAVIQNITSACEAYHTQFRSYPGAVSNTDLIRIGGGRNLCTSSENLVLSLSGGLWYDGTVVAPADPVKFDPALLGTGPRNLKDANGKQYQPFIEGIARTSGKIATNDTDIPEFADGYSDNLPVLYLRANVGKTGIVSENMNPAPAGLPMQYDVSELYPYTKGLAPTPVPAALAPNVHGLRFVGLDSDPIEKSLPNNAAPYFRSPTMGGTTPRKVDGFILIGAGPDRIFGTADDLTNFGEVMP